MSVFKKINLKDLSNFNLTHFFKRFSQEAVLVLCFYCLIFYLINTFVLSSGYAKKMMNYQNQKVHFRLAQDVKGLHMKMDDLNKKLFDTEDTNFFISKINQILKEYNALDIEIRPQGVERSDDIRLLRFEVSCDLGYEKILKLLNRLEDAEKMQFIESCEIFLDQEKAETVEMVENPVLVAKLKVVFFSKVSS